MHFDAVLFDCDGVLVDSEAITCGALRDMLEENGWRLTLAECMALFVGHTVRSKTELIERQTGKPLTDAFMDEFYRRRNVRLETEITLVDGASEAVRFWHAQCQGRSGHETPRSKPFPDVYLAAAAHLQADPARCLVVEDTTVGVTAGVAAGATVWGYAPPGADAQALRDAGAVRTLVHMRELTE